MMSTNRAHSLVLLASTLGVVACAKNPSIPSTSRTWVLRWSDEFDGPSGGRLDSTKWNYDIGDGCDQRNCGWGNNEKEYYSADAENISTNGQGQLVIVGKVAAAGLTCYYGPCRYTSAKITTRGKLVVQPAGKLEARIKLASGQGLWPAFWMLGST